MANPFVAAAQVALIRGGRETVCPTPETHTAAPDGYLEWHAWAEGMQATHRQIRCEGCGLFAVWVPRDDLPSPPPPETAHTAPAGGSSFVPHEVIR